MKSESGERVEREWNRVRSKRVRREGEGSKRVGREEEV